MEERQSAEGGWTAMFAAVRGKHEVKEQASALMDTSLTSEHLLSVSHFPSVSKATCDVLTDMPCQARNQASASMA